MLKVQIMALSTLIFSGCASTTDIVPYGKDSYLLAAEDIWGGHSRSSLQVKAAQRASQFCASQGKKFIVRNTNTTGTQGFTSTSSSLIFSCVSEDDKEFLRPNLRKEADTVIEDRRR